MRKQLGKIGLRKCSMCKNILPLTFQHFYRKKTIGCLGYDKRCRECNRSRNREKKLINNRKKEEDYSGYIYIMKCNNYYKIGNVKSDIIKKRLVTLQTGNPYEITLIKKYYVEDRFFEEKKLHYKYKKENIRGERFELSYQDIIDI